MNTKRRLITSFLVSALLLTGMACTTGGDIETIEGEAGAEESCFNVRDVRSFDAIHDRHVYVRCRRGKH